jgi:hypothetical protein
MIIHARPAMPAWRFLCARMACPTQLFEVSPQTHGGINDHQNSTFDASDRNPFMETAMGMALRRSYRREKRPITNRPRKQRPISIATLFFSWR